MFFSLNSHFIINYLEIYINRVTFKMFIFSCSEFKQLQFFANQFYEIFHVFLSHIIQLDFLALKNVTFLQEEYHVRQSNQFSFLVKSAKSKFDDSSCLENNLIGKSMKNIELKVLKTVLNSKILILFILFVSMEYLENRFLLWKSCTNLSFRRQTSFKVNIASLLILLKQQQLFLLLISFFIFQWTHLITQSIHVQILRLFTLIHNVNNVCWKWRMLKNKYQRVKMWNIPLGKIALTVTT